MSAIISNFEVGNDNDYTYGYLKYGSRIINVSWNIYISLNSLNMLPTYKWKPFCIIFGRKMRK